MATQIRDIYRRLADISITLDGETLTAWTPETMRNRVNSAVLPLRILSPIGVANTGTFTPPVFASDGSGEAQWTIYELVLIAPAPEGRGLREHADEMLSLIESYINAVAQDSRLMPGVLIENVTAEAGVYTYNDVNYFAVEFRVQVTEVMG